MTYTDGCKRWIRPATESEVDEYNRMYTRRVPYGAFVLLDETDEVRNCVTIKQIIDNDFHRDNGDKIIYDLVNRDEILKENRMAYEKTKW